MQSVTFRGCTGLTGAIDKLVLPDGMQTVSFYDCTGLTGAIDKLVLPEGMKEVNFTNCQRLEGNIGQLNLPVGMKSVNFEYCRGLTGTLVALSPSMKAFGIGSTGVKIDVAAIEWPANATALEYNEEDSALVCRTTDPDESKEGAETSEIRIKCYTGQVIGDIGELVLPQGMQSVNFHYCKGLTGTAES